MLKIPRPAAPPERGGSGTATCPGIDIDLERAPVVFGWLLYRQDCFADTVHLECLYRLDRVGIGAPAVQAALQPGVYYGQSIEMLRALLRVQQRKRLPSAPHGCHWVGPLLVTEVSVPAKDAVRAAAPPTQEQTWPAGRRARLAFARAIARRLLHDPKRT